MNIIEANNIYKTFNGTTVLNDVNLVLEKGLIYGLIGRNGSGKTVLMKIICGLLNPTSGALVVNGKIQTYGEPPRNIGAIIENPGFLPTLNAYKNLEYLASIRNRIGKKEICIAMEKVGLSPSDKKRVGKYSLGMKQRLGLAQAIMEDPDILVLDEPMNGLDKNGVIDMRNYLLELKSQGKTILIASHSSDDIDILCDSVFEIDQGHLYQKD